MKICPGCNNANSSGDYQGPTCPMCMGDGFVSSINTIPPHLHWLIGKGRTRPTEPLFAAQLIDPESGIAIAEGEAETLDGAIAAAVSALPETHALTVNDGGSPE